MQALPNCKRPCKDCPFRKDSLKGWLGASRMEDILNSGSFVCHKRTYLQCAGHMLINGVNNEFVRLAQRLEIDLELSGRELIFDTREECIAHHNDNSAL